MQKLGWFLAFLFGLLFISCGADAYTDSDLTYLSEQLQIPKEDLQVKSANMTKEEADKYEDQLQQDLEDPVKQMMMADEAIKSWVKYGAWVLKRRGYTEEADNLEMQWEIWFEDYLLNTYYSGEDDIHSHPPLNAWLAQWYKKMQDLLGQRLCDLLHLSDIDTINWTWPVATSPCNRKNLPPQAPWGQEYYVNNFVPFSGSVGYFAAWGACVGATFGAGAIGLICSPVGDIVKWAMLNKFGEPLGNRIYLRFVPDHC